MPKNKPKNPNAFKHLVNPGVVKKIADSILRHYPAFEHQSFLKKTTSITELEMKDRVRLIAAALSEFLPKNYKLSSKILLKSMNEELLKGFELWPYSEYISQNGLDYFDLSFSLMYKLTQLFTSEFAVRPFLLKNHKKALNHLLKLTSDKNVHIRRWVSEGTRPLLPWG